MDDIEIIDEPVKDFEELLKRFPMHDEHRQQERAVNDALQAARPGDIIIHVRSASKKYLSCQVCTLEDLPGVMLSMLDRQGVLLEGWLVLGRDAGRWIDLQPYYDQAVIVRKHQRQQSAASEAERYAGGHGGLKKRDV